MRSRIAGLAILACLVGVASAACGTGTASTPEQAVPQPSGVSSPGTVPLPTALSNLKTLLQKDATSGSAVAGTFYGHRGEVWIDFSCLGPGTATVHYPPVGSVVIPCGGSAVNATRNQIFFPGDHQISLRIDAPTTAQWSVLVQQ